MIFEFLPSRLFRTVFFSFCLVSGHVYIPSIPYPTLSMSWSVNMHHCFPSPSDFGNLNEFLLLVLSSLAVVCLSVCLFARLSYQKILEEKFQFQTLASTLFVGILNTHIFRRCMDDKFLSNCAAPRRLARKNKMKIKIQMKTYMYIKFISETGETRLTRCRLHCFFA